jgi:hypothetical protein
MFDVSDTSDEELYDAVVGGEPARRRATAQRFRQLAEFDARNLAARFRVTTAYWYAWKTGVSHSTARREVTAAVKLVGHFPAVMDALEAGEISVDHAHVISRAANPRIVEGLAAIQKELLEDAKEMRFAAWKRHVGALADELDLDGGHDPDKDSSIGISVIENFDGTFRIEGTLSQEDGLVFKTEVDRLADQIFRNTKNDIETANGDHPHEFRGRQFFNAKALVEMARRSAARNAGDSKPPRPEVILVWDLATNTPTTEDGSPIRPEVFRNLATDAMWRAMWTDDGVPLKLGRTRRLASADQRRALAVRDGGCIFPKCPRPPSHCRSHHAAHYGRDDGETDLDNLFLLCPTHHGLIHTKGWTTELNPDQTLTWTTPAGEIIHSERHIRHTDLP